MVWFGGIDAMLPAAVAPAAAFLLLLLLLAADHCLGRTESDHPAAPPAPLPFPAHSRNHSWAADGYDSVQLIVALIDASTHG